MIYKDIKELNLSNKTNLMSYLSTFSEKNDVYIKNAAKYKFQIISNCNNIYILENSYTKNKSKICSINDIINFYRTDFTYISNLYLLKNNKLPFVITQGIIGMIVNKLQNLENCHTIKYVKVDSLLLIKGKVNLLGGKILFDYHNSLIAVYKDNIVFLYTENKCFVADTAFDVLEKVNVKHNFDSIRGFIYDI